MSTYRHRRLAALAYLQAPRFSGLSLYLLAFFASFSLFQGIQYFFDAKNPQNSQAVLTSHHRTTSTSLHRTSEVFPQADKKDDGLAATGAVEHDQQSTSDAQTHLTGIPFRITTVGLAVEGEQLPAQLADEFELLLHYFRNRGVSFSDKDEFRFLLHDGLSKTAEQQLYALEFPSEGKPLHLIRYEQAPGHYNYYTLHGRAILPTFLPHPVDLKRAKVSSRFSQGRKHPISGIMQAHKGVDYAANTGTPVYAASSGRIEFRGRKGSFGQTLIINHGNGYKTLYAHLSMYARDTAERRKVDLGQIIGYVGNSGRSTGPHLHYELMIDNVSRDPLVMPVASPYALTLSQRHALLAYASILKENVNSLAYNGLGQVEKTSMFF